MVTGRTEAALVCYLKGMLINCYKQRKSLPHLHGSGFITFFKKEFQLGKLLERSNGGKEKDISSIEVFKLVFSFVFAGKTFLRFLQIQTEVQSGAKDTVYRFLNSPRTNWRKFLFLLSLLVVSQKKCNYLPPEIEWMF